MDSSFHSKRQIRRDKLPQASPPASYAFPAFQRVSKTVKELRVEQMCFLGKYDHIQIEIINTYHDTGEKRAATVKFNNKEKIELAKFLKDSLSRHETALHAFPDEDSKITLLNLGYLLRVEKEIGRLSIKTTKEDDNDADRRIGFTLSLKDLKKLILLLER